MNTENGSRAPMPNTEAARALFSQLGQIHLVAITPDGPATGQDFGVNVEGALAWAEKESAAGRNIYFTVNAVQPGYHKKPSKKQITAARFCHVDIDPPVDGAPWDKCEVLADLQALQCPPSFVVDSGNGLQAFWRLVEPVTDWQFVETLNAEIAHRLNGDACQNIDRPMRVPGFPNKPNAAKRKRGCVQVLAALAQPDNGVRYYSEELAAAFTSGRAGNDAAALAEWRQRNERPSDQELNARCQRGYNWHNSMTSLVARMVGRDQTDAEILGGLGPTITLGGYSLEQTHSQIQIAIDTARKKWPRPNTPRDGSEVDQSNGVPCREVPRPLYRELPAGLSMPVEALGPVLGEAAKAIEAVIQCPLECAVNSVLAVAALAAQGRANVILPIGQGKAAPLSLYLLTVLESGERKSSADGMALKPVRDYERELHQTEATERQAHAAKLAALEANSRHLTNALKKDRAALESALLDLGPAPLPPLLSVLAPSGDQTMEGLFRIYQHGHPSVAMLCDDAASFLGSHSLKTEQKMATTANLCRAWDGSKLERIRGGDGVLVLYDRRLACHLMVQPGVAAGFLSDEQFADQGLLARFLVSAPVGRAGTRFREDDQYRALARQAAADLEPYNAAIAALLRLPVRWKNENDRTQGVEMASLQFTEDARARYVEFANKIEAELSPGGSLTAVKAFASKLPENAARIAGTLTLIADAEATEVAATKFNDATLIAEHYLSETLRLRATGMIDPALRLADTLRLWLLERSDDTIGLRQIYRLGPNSIRQAATARAAMKLLEEHGWVIPVGNGATVDDEFCREAWTIVRPVAVAELSRPSQLSQVMWAGNEIDLPNGMPATVATPATAPSRSAKIFSHFLVNVDTDLQEYDL